MLAESEEGVEDVRVKGIHTGSKVGGWSATMIPFLVL